MSTAYDSFNQIYHLTIKGKLIAKLPDMEIDSVISEEMEAKVWEIRMPDLTLAGQLAVIFDRLSYDYDAILYHDSICTMSKNVPELAERIKQGDSKYLTDWLKEVNLISIFENESREAVIRNILNTKKYVDDMEMLEVISRVPEKLNSMSDEEFEVMEFVVAE